MGHDMSDILTTLHTISTGLTRYQQRQLAEENEKALKGLEKPLQRVLEDLVGDDLKLTFKELRLWEDGDGGQFRWDVKSRKWFTQPASFVDLHTEDQVNRVVHEHGYRSEGTATLQAGVIYLALKKDPKAFEEWAEGQDPLLVDALRELKEEGVW